MKKVIITSFIAAAVLAAVIFFSTDKTISKNGELTMDNIKINVNVNLSVKRYSFLINRLSGNAAITTDNSTINHDFKLHNPILKMNGPYYVSTGLYTQYDSGGQYSYIMYYDKDFNNLILKSSSWEIIAADEEFASHIFYRTNND